MKSELMTALSVYFRVFGENQPHYSRSLDEDTTKIAHEMIKVRDAKSLSEIEETIGWWGGWEPESYQQMTLLEAADKIQAAWRELEN